MAEINRWRGRLQMSGPQLHIWGQKAYKLMVHEWAVQCALRMQLNSNQTHLNIWQQFVARRRKANNVAANVATELRSERERLREGGAWLLLACIRGHVAGHLHI